MKQWVSIFAMSLLGSGQFVNSTIDLVEDTYKPFVAAGLSALMVSLVPFIAKRNPDGTPAEQPYTPDSKPKV